MNRLLPQSALVSALALVLGTTASFAAPTFTISWWGYNGEKMDANIIQPFKEICGCEIQFETGNNADRLNKLKARGNSGVDVIFLSDSFAQIGIEAGSFQKIDHSKLSNLSKLYEIAQKPQGDYGPAYSIGRAGIVYDAAKVQPIASWNDLWREDLKGQITLPGITTTAGPYVVMQAGKKAGVDAFTDPKPAFAEIAALRANTIKNYNTGSEMVNLISTGEATVAIAQDFTMSRLTEAVPSMTWAALSDGDIATLNTINIPAKAENVDLAYKFIDFMLSTEVQQREAETGVDAPVNTEVKLTPEQAAQWTYGADMINSLNRVDYVAMNKAKPEWIDMWNETFNQ